MVEAVVAAKAAAAGVDNKEAKVAAIPGTKAVVKAKATSAAATPGVETPAVEAGAATPAGATTLAMAAVANKEATVAEAKLAGVVAALVPCGATQGPVTGPRLIR